MKKIFCLTFISIVSISYSQDIQGQWDGLLKIPNVQLKIIFKITKVENSYKTTMDSPDQGAYGIPVDHTEFDGKTLKLEAKKIGIVYNGQYVENKIVGIFEQSGQKLNLDLQKK